jgi:TRAP-type C4-dicarboxylate transport system permease small subunit
MGALAGIRSTVGALARACASGLRMVLGLGLAVLVITVTVQIVGRFVFKSTPVWTEALSGVLLTWLSFLGAAYALHSRESLAIDLLPKAAHGVVQAAMAFLVALAGGTFAWILLSAGLQQVELLGPSILMGLDIPTAWLYASAPVAAVFMLIFLIDGALTPASNQERDAT